ncbi:hypothetical protein [Ochrobactrum sp. S1502_03]|uniref:hypothetical protein n=1 Tax=Ochrobactrum sp. S1502_03 TaxID=3108451 RepID=UPI0037CC10BA
MGEFSLEIAETSLCEQCETELEISIPSCTNCGANTYRRTFPDFISALEHFHLQDARYGGLVLGRTGPEDDIPMYTYAGKGIYALAGLMQGGEYILSQAATLKYMERLHEINSEKGEHLIPFYPMNTEYSSIINTNFMPYMGGLWISGRQFVINRVATQRHYAELEHLNWEANQDLASQNPIVET